jgi:hypothetical protein
MDFACQNPATTLDADEPLAAHTALAAPRGRQEPRLAAAPLVSEHPTNTLQHRPPITPLNLPLSLKTKRLIFDLFQRRDKTMTLVACRG